MAVAGVKFLIPAIHHNCDPTSKTSMDKEFFDLNKHALDLNELPSNDLRLEASSSHEPGPRRGGWLELFHNMFGHDQGKLDLGPFASCTTMLNSRYINYLPQADGIQQDIDPRLLNSQHSQLVHQKVHNGHVAGQYDNAAERSNLAFMPDKPGKNCKPFAPEEVNHPNIMASVPLLKHAVGGSQIRKPSMNASGQPGCAVNVLPPFFSSSEGLTLKTGNALWGCNGNGPQHMSRFYPVVDQASIGSSISQRFDQHKASVPMWDLTSQSSPKWTADFQPLGRAEASCITSSGLFSQMQVLDKTVSGSSSAQVSDVAFTKANKDFGALTVFREKKEKGAICSAKKGSSRSYGDRALGLINAENVPSLSEDIEKGQDPRIRIITSPDWLPAGWITELKTRMAGSTAGTTDKYYKDPVTGRRFRSKNEVLSFIQTGRSCKNKSQLKLVEDFAAISTLPLMLPRQDRITGPSDNSQEVLARTTFLTSANDFNSQVPMCHSLCPPNISLERLKISQEQMNLSQSSDICRVLDIGALVEGSDSVREIMKLEANEVGKSYLSIGPAIPNGCMYNDEPVHICKRKVLEESLFPSAPKRLHTSTAREPQERDKWLYCMEQISSDSDRQELSTCEEPDLKTAHSSYPGLLNRQEPNGAQDKAVSDYFTARYKANLKALGLYDTSMIRNVSEINLGCMKDLQPRTTSVIKVGEKKSVKLILKQERDLLATLGRKLCVEFLASAKESSKQ